MTNVQSVSRIKRPDRGVILTAVILVLIYALVFVLEQILPPTSMLFTVLKKGATYALVAVSMNLLNGFTGLFSLGQAGFMLIGAYTYGILTIPVAQRAAVYQYYDGGLIQFAMPVIPALILAGIVAAACRCFGSRATIWRSPRWALRRSFAPSSSGINWARSPTAPTCCACFPRSMISTSKMRRER